MHFHHTGRYTPSSSSIHPRSQHGPTSRGVDDMMSRSETYKNFRGQASANSTTDDVDEIEEDKCTDRYVQSVIIIPIPRTYNPGQFVMAFFP